MRLNKKPKHLKKINEKIESFQGLDYQSLADKTAELATLSRNTLYPSTPDAYLAMYGTNSPKVQHIKSEIRSLKGMLLSRRNVPTK